MQSVAITLKRAFWVILLCFAIASFPLPSLAVTVEAAVMAAVGNAGVF
jgi:hypothetical protein